jgi:hypothetical protein
MSAVLRDTGCLQYFWQYLWRYSEMRHAGSTQRCGILTSLKVCLDMSWVGVSCKQAQIHAAHAVGRVLHVGTFTGVVTLMAVFGCDKPNTTNWFNRAECHSTGYVSMSAVGVTEHAERKACTREFWMRSLDVPSLSTRSTPSHARSCSSARAVVFSRWRALLSASLSLCCNCACTRKEQG